MQKQAMSTSKTYFFIIFHIHLILNKVIKIEKNKHTSYY